jgi:predicted acyltransferase (DUF342 family)
VPANAVTLIAGTGNTLTARVTDIAGNVTALTLSDNGYTLDTSAPSVLEGTHTVTISNDTDIDGDRITSDAQVKVVAHALLLSVATTQSVPLALTCKVSPVAKVRALPNDKVSLT